MLFDFSKELKREEAARCLTQNPITLAWKPLISIAIAPEVPCPVATARRVAQAW